ncbi:hypothetical protein SLE2022_257840 [Rubroshorea leprosula]
MTLLEKGSFLDNPTYAVALFTFPFLYCGVNNRPENSRRQIFRFGSYMDAMSMGHCQQFYLLTFVLYCLHHITEFFPTCLAVEKVTELEIAY